MPRAANESSLPRFLGQGAIPFDPDNLIEFTAENQITSRPKYLESLEGIEGNLNVVRAVGFYRLPGSVHCGLSAGHTPHVRGLLILVSNGREEWEIQVGKDCGVSLFGDAVRILWNQINAVKALRSLRTQLETLIALAPERLDRCERLWNEYKGGAWLAAFRQNFNREMPPEVVSRIIECMRGGEPMVYEMVEMTEDERALQSVSGTALTSSTGRSRLTHKPVPIAPIRGIGAWTTNIDLQLRRGLCVELRQLRSLDLSKLSAPQIRSIKAKAIDFDSSFALAERTVEAGREFFTPENFALLCKIIPPSIARRDLERRAWNFEKGTLKRAA